MQEYIEFISNNLMMSFAWVAVATMLIHSLIKDKISGIKVISTQEATQLINKQDAIIVDVRTKEEFQSGHIVNAKHITLSQIEEGSFSSIENNKQTPIIVVCESGTRSSSAAAKLVKAEFTQVASLSTGMSGWRTANLPTTKK